MKKIIQKTFVYLLISLTIFMFKMPVQASDLQTFAPVFDSTYYAEKYKDVADAFGSDETLLFHHFLTCGMAEGRQGNAEFNVKVYRNNYADLNTAFGDNWVSYYIHYINSGKAEGRVSVPISSNNTTTATDNTATNIHPMFTEEQWNFANRVIELVNQERSIRGLNSVTSLQNLSSAAQARAKETVEKFSHTRPDGSSCFTIFDEYNVAHGYAGENIAAGQSTPEAVVKAWMNSPGHKANILNKNYNHLGVGCYTTDNSRYGIHWCQMFTD